MLTLLYYEIVYLSTIIFVIRKYFMTKNGKEKCQKTRLDAPGMSLRLTYIERKPIDRRNKIIRINANQIGQENPCFMLQHMILVLHKLMDAVGFGPTFPGCKATAV